MSQSCWLRMTRDNDFPFEYPGEVPSSPNLFTLYRTHASRLETRANLLGFSGEIPCRSSPIGPASTGEPDFLGFAPGIRVICR